MESFSSVRAFCISAVVGCSPAMGGNLESRELVSESALPAPGKEAGERWWGEGLRTAGDLTPSSIA